MKAPRPSKVRVVIEGRPCIVLQSGSWEPRWGEEGQGRDFEGGLQGLQFPRKGGQEQVATSRPLFAPPRPAPRGPSPPHPIGRATLPPPRPLLLHPPVPPPPPPSLSKFTPGRDSRRKRTMAVYLGMLRLGRLCIASLGARGPRTLLSRPRANSKLQGVRALRYPEQLSEKRGGWAVPRRELLQSLAGTDAHHPITQAKGKARPARGLGLLLVATGVPG